MVLTVRYTSRPLSTTPALLERIVVNLPKAVAAIHEHIDNGNTPDDDRPKPDDAGIRGKGDHSDPTADAALAHVAAYEHHLDDIEARLATLTLTLGLLLQDCDRWVARPTLPKLRCSGGRTIDEWSRPDCTEWVPETSRGSGVLRGDGLCDACRVRKSRWERRQAEGAA